MSKPFQDSIVLFGDSITSRQDVPLTLHTHFAAAYRRTLDVLNRGYGGYNTRFALPLVDQIFAKKEDAATASTIRLVTVWFGTNDAALESAPTHQHVSIPEYTANLRSMLEKLTSSDSPYAVAHTEGMNIVLITPPPFYAEMLDAEGRTHRKLENTKKYVDVVIQVGEEYKAKQEGKKWRIGVVNMWDGIYNAAGGKGEELRPYFTDGLHLETKGYQVFWDQYTDLVRTTFKGRGLSFTDLSDLPLRVPDWGDLDYSDSESAVKGMKLPAIRQ